jgi:hypothetical protein
MLSQILCSLFLICADVQSPAITTLSADDGLPSWSQVTPHATPIIQRWEGTGPVQNCSQSARGICYLAYLDEIAEPDVPTIGHGQTRLFNPDGSVQRSVRMGDRLTAEEADRQFPSVCRSSTGAPIDGASTSQGSTLGPMRRSSA